MNSTPPPTPARLRRVDARTARLRALILATLAFAGASLSLAAPATPAAQAEFVAQPFAPRSGPRGATLFTRVDPAASGLITENKYADPDMWGRRAREFDLGGIGTGVAIGDYDGDGRADIFVVSKTESCRLFRNLGDWHFEDVTEKAGVADHGADATTWKQGATFVDVNNDGRLDLYVCRFAAPNLLYINQGDGTFREEAHAYHLDIKDATVMAAFGDYDRDGWLDVFIQTNVLDAIGSPEGRRDYLFHNHGDGTFTDLSAQSGVASGPTHGNSALWWDFDDDGWPDLYVANDFAVPDRLYHNNHDGTFADVTTQVIPHAPYSSMGSDLADVDNDGRLDVFVADMAATTHVKDQRTMAETRARLRSPAPGSSEIRQFPFSALYLNTGTGRCLEAAQLAGIAATDWTWSPRWEDLDEDGRVDLHVTNGMYREIHNQDLIARRASAETPALRAQVTRNSPMLAESNLAFRNLGELRFKNVSAAWGLDHTGVSFGSALGDLDGDGDLDLVYANYQDGVTVLRNDNDHAHHVSIALRGTRSNRFGIGARIVIETAAGRQVRTLTLSRGFMSSSEPIAHFGLGETTTIARLTVNWPSGVVQTFENVAADQRLTLTEPIETAPLVPPPPAAPVPTSQFLETAGPLGLQVTVAFEAHDEFLDQRLLPFGLDRCGPTIAIGDLAGHGRESVVLGGTTRDPLRILTPAVGQPGWAAATPPGFAEAPGVNDGPVLLFDAMGQGHADLLVTAGGTSEAADSPAYQPRLYINDGHGDFTAAPPDTLPPLLISVGAACVADFDRNGRLDLFLGGRVIPGNYPATPTSALLVNRGGKFEDVTDTVAPALRHVGLVTAALWSDVDGDGFVDLLVAAEWGTVRYFHNESGRGFADWTERAGFAATGNGWWRSLASADFNGDGRPDFAVGNLGENTPYQADAAHPALLYVGDFAGRGNRDLVEAYEENGQLYPRRSRSDLGAAIPAILRRYRSNNDYAKATVPELIGAEKLATATRLTATELRSGTFLSQPDGTYHFVPWPRVAQISPANGLAAGDFDGDGRADLYVVQNSVSPAPAIGRFDGGLSQLLRGDGRGGFSTVPLSESGLVVPGETKALAVLDLNADGWPDFIVTRGDEPTLAFRNQPLASRRSVRVTLAGRPGNPTAVGAYVTAEYADGTTQAAAVTAGAGGAAQSASALFFGSTDANPLRRLRIRWPSGVTTTAPDWGAALPATIRVAAPAP